MEKNTDLETKHICGYDFETMLSTDDIPVVEGEVWNPDLHRTLQRGRHDL